MRAVPQPRGHLLAQGTQEALQVQGLRMLQVQPHRGEAAGHGGAGKYIFLNRFPAAMVNFVHFELKKVLLYAQQKSCTKLEIVTPFLS